MGKNAGGYCKDIIVLETQMEIVGRFDRFDWCCYDVYEATDDSYIGCFVIEYVDDSPVGTGICNLAVIAVLQCRTDVSRERNRAGCSSCPQLQSR